MRVLLFCCALICASLTSTAQKRIETPIQPVSIVPVGSAVHIMCARTDANFNGDLDEGDTPASWLSIDAASRQVIRNVEFGWGNVSVQRFGFSRQKSVFDVGFNDEVYRYNIAEQRNIDIIYSGTNASVSTSEDGLMTWVAQRPNFTDPGTIVEIDVQKRTTSTFPTGVNPQAPLPFVCPKGSGLAAICEGTFGGNNGTLEIWTDVQGIRTRSTIVVGDTPNHLLIHGGRAYITVNGSHQIVVVDLAQQMAVDTIQTGTSGYDGPRECVIDTSAQDGKTRLYVTTFTSDVRIFDLSTGQRIGTLAVGAKPEGAAIVGRELWVTRTFVEGGYTATRDVMIFDLDSPSSVASSDHQYSPTAIVALGGSLHLPFTLDTDATLADLTGRTMAVSAVVSDAQTLDCRQLPHGVYALRSGKHSVTIVR